MSFIKNLFNNPPQKLHVLSIEKKIDRAFEILYQFTPLVTAGIDDMQQLKHDKELIKNSILFIYREMKRQPENSFILKQHVTLETKEKYDRYLDLLSQMLIALSDFSINSIPKMDKYIGNVEKMNRYDFRKDLEASTNNLQEKSKESAYYLSELDSIENDLKNNTSFKKIRFYDYE